MRFLGAEGPPGDRPVHGRGDADDAGQEPRRARLGHDAAAGERQGEAAALGADADVHRQDHGDPDADGGPVDGGDHRLARAEDPQRQLATHVAGAAPQRFEARRVGVVAPGAGGQVGPSREEVSRAGDDDGADVLVGVGVGEGVEQRIEHRVGDGVPGLRTVDRDDSDTPLPREDDVAFGHVVNSIY